MKANTGGVPSLELEKQEAAVYQGREHSRTKLDRQSNKNEHLKPNIMINQESGTNGNKDETTERTITKDLDESESLVIQQTSLQRKPISFKQQKKELLE